jgi:hypothetical protein
MVAQEIVDVPPTPSYAHGEITSRSAPRSIPTCGRTGSGMFLPLERRTTSTVCRIGYRI